jgi:hypothetical protein
MTVRRVCWAHRIGGPLRHDVTLTVWDNTVKRLELCKLIKHQHVCRWYHSILPSAGHYLHYRMTQWAGYELVTVSHMEVCFLVLRPMRLTTDVWGNANKWVTNGSKTAVMCVIGFLCVSLGSSTIQLHDSVGSRRACASSQAGFSSQNGDRAWGCNTEEQSCCAFCGQKDSMQRIFIKKCFLFTVGSVCRVKWFTTRSKNMANFSLTTKRLKRRCGSANRTPSLVTNTCENMYLSHEINITSSFQSWTVFHRHLWYGYYSDIWQDDANRIRWTTLFYKTHSRNQHADGSLCFPHTEAALWNLNMEWDQAL